MSNKIPWINLDQYQLRLMALMLPSGAKKLLLLGADQCPEAAKRLGFMKSPSGYWVRDGLRYGLEEFRREFPDAPVEERPVDEVRHILRPKAAPEPKKADQGRPRLSAGVRLLGRNYLGQEVFQESGSRFVRSAGNAPLPETGDDPARFLRAPTAEALALCADSLAGEIAGGRVLRFSDLGRFATIVFGETVSASDLRLRQVQEALEAALIRRLAAGIREPDEAAFRMGLRLYEGQPVQNARTSGSVDLQQFSTPLPMSLVAQRLLGVAAELEGKTILEPTIGNGALVLGLPQATIIGIELDPARARQVQALRPDITAIAGDAIRYPFPRHDYCIGNPPFGKLPTALGNRVNFRGLQVARQDHLIVLRALEARADEGRGVFIIGADSAVGSRAGKLAGSSRHFFNWLADHYHVEAVAEMGGDLYSKSGAGFPTRLVVVGRRGPGGQQVPDTLPILNAYEELWAWSEQTLQRRRQADQAITPLPLASPAADRQDPEKPAPARENSYQSPYVPMSQVGEASSMIPRNLQGPLRRALERLQEEVGDIDRFVADRLGWTVEELSGYLSPEQVDAVALAISALENDKGFIETDQTGMGKGRVLAALARYAALNRVPVTFMTEKANLFSDFYRDLNDIASAPLFDPFILNQGIIIQDNAGATIAASSRGDEVQKVIEERCLPEGKNLLLCTYSQVNRPSEKSSKADAFPALASGSLLILDESHNAAGDSNTSTTVSAAIAEAWGTVYSSATYAKNARNMHIYYKVFPPTVDMASLPETLRVGGEILQEVLSAMLAEDGKLVRREHDLSALVFETCEDAGNLIRNRDLSDRLAEILEPMAYLAGDIQRIVLEKNQEIRKRLEDLPAEARRGNRMGVSSLNFGSRLYNVNRQFLMSLKVDQTVNLALTALAEGRKPVIVIENTMESLLKETLFPERAPTEESAGEDSEIQARVSREGNALTLSTPLTFRDVLDRLLDKIMRITESDRYGNKSVKRVEEIAGSAEQAANVQRLEEIIRDRIRNFPPLPMSPLDEIRDRIQSQGYVCGELSGRSLRTGVDAEGRQRVDVRPARDRNDIIREFNAGTMDAIIVTRAGCTGISLHASARFADQRQRELIEEQIPNNVAERMQFFGRVNRKDQVCPPIIRTLSSLLPGEARLLAMQNNKLAKLSANTTSNRDNAAIDEEVLNVLNPVGNEVALRFLENNPAIARRLGIELAEEPLPQDDHHVNRLMSRIMLLSVAEQERILREITTEYKAVLKEYEAKGQNPFKSVEHNWRAGILRREIYEGAERDDYESVFDHPIYLTEVEYERVRQPIRSPKVRALVEQAHDSLRRDPQGLHGCLNTLRQRRDALLESSLPKRFASVAEALSDPAGPNATQALKTRLDFLEQLLSNTAPGKIIALTSADEQVVMGIAGKIALPEKGREHLLGGYELAVLIPGENAPCWVTAKMLADDPAFKILSPGALSLEVFDKAPEGVVRERRLLLDGNLFKASQAAAEHGLGSNIIYTTVDGVRQRGVLLHKQLTRRTLHELPVRLEQPRQAADFLLAHPEPLYSALPFSIKQHALLVRDNGETRLTVPGTRLYGGDFFLDKRIIELVGEFSGTRALMRVNVPDEKLTDLLFILYNKGRSLYASADHRQWANDWKASAVQTREQDAHDSPAPTAAIAL